MEAHLHISELWDNMTGEQRNGEREANEGRNVAARRAIKIEKLFE